MKSFEPGFLDKQPISQTAESFAAVPDGFKMVDLERAAPNVTREMIRVVLNRLRKEQRLYCKGRGPAATWYKLSNNNDLANRSGE